MSINLLSEILKDFPPRTSMRSRFLDIFGNKSHAVFDINMTNIVKFLRMPCFKVSFGMSLCRYVLGSVVSTKVKDACCGFT